jgi:hypothetical protein
MDAMKYYKFFLILFLLFLFAQHGFGIKSLDEFLKSPYDSCCIGNRNLAILLKVADKVIDKEQGYIEKTAKYKKRKDVNKRPLYLNIQEGDTYNGMNTFSIIFSDASFYSNYLPTDMFEYQGLYIVIYFKNKKPLSKRKIPEIFFKKSEDYLINEASWTAFICKESGKTLVVETSFLSYEEIKQIQDFSCDRKDNDDIQISIEDPIKIHK